MNSQPQLITHDDSYEVIYSDHFLQEDRDRFPSVSIFFDFKQEFLRYQKNYGVLPDGVLKMSYDEMSDFENEVASAKLFLTKSLNELPTFSLFCQDLFSRTVYSCDVHKKNNGEFNHLEAGTAPELITPLTPELQIELDAFALMRAQIAILEVEVLNIKKAYKEKQNLLGAKVFPNSRIHLPKSV